MKKCGRMAGWLANGTVGAGMLAALMGIAATAAEAAAAPKGVPPASIPVAIEMGTGERPASAAVPAPAAVAPAPAAVPAPAAASAAAAAPAKPAVARPAKVTTNVLNIRARPGLQYEVIGKFKMGDAVQVMGELEEWYEVQVPASAEAWVSARFLDADGKVMADRLRVHSGPGVVFNTYAFVKRGDTMKRQGEASVDGWQKIEAPAGATAWVNKKFVTLDSGAGAVPKVKEVVAMMGGGEAVETGKAGGDQSETATAAPAPEKPAPAPAPDAAKTGVVKPDAASPAAAPAEGAAVPKPEAAKPVTPAVPPPAEKKTESAPAVPAVPAKPAPTPAAPSAAKEVTPPTVAPAAPGTVIAKEGFVKSLENQASASATHYLCIEEGRNLVPVCYLVSKKLSLKEWEGQNVRLYGREIWNPGWKRPVLDVTGIQKQPAP